MTCDLICLGLEDALAQPGCPVCRIGRDTATSYLVSLFYENVNDITTRLALDASIGFCAEHADEAARLGDALGAGIIYEDLVRATKQKLAKLLAELPKLPKRNAWRRRLGLTPRDAGRETLVLRPRAACPACRSRDAAEERSTWGLLRHMDHLRPALEASEGLCLRHLAASLEQEGFEAEKAVLLSVEKGKLEALQGELQELIRKFDYRFSHEPKGAEADSWRRAMAKISGTHHLGGGRPGSTRRGGRTADDTAHGHGSGTASQAQGKCAGGVSRPGGEP